MNSLSVSGKNWVLRKYSEENSNFLKDNFSLDEITSKLLSIRQIKKNEISSFLNPSIKNFLPNPYDLIDMEKSTLRTAKAIFQKEKFGIFGDYDVDGATSTALLGNYFSELNLEYETYIPDRKKEGYGPTIKSFKELINKKVKIIFTVDCGTLSFEAINFAKDNNVDVIVLDHHQSEVKLPNAFSIVNPNRLDDKSNLQYLCAAGVSFMFLVSLNRELRNKNWFTKNNIKEPNLIDCLDLVSLGTVCDVVPLIGLNRAIVKQGLKVFKSKKNLGLKTLLDICKIETNPSTYHLGYLLGPISKPSIDLADAFPISPFMEIRITGLLNISFKRAATIPITPSCQFLPLKIKTGSLDVSLVSFKIFFKRSFSNICLSLLN